MVRWLTTSGRTTNHETPENPANHRPLLRVLIVVVVVSRLSTCPTVPVLYPVSMLNTLPPREWLYLLPLEMQQTFFHDTAPPLEYQVAHISFEFDKTHDYLFGH